MARCYVSHFIWSALVYGFIGIFKFDNTVSAIGQHCARHNANGGTKINCTL